jgi:hypothetical protein
MGNGLSAVVRGDGLAPPADCVVDSKGIVTHKWGIKVPPASDFAKHRWFYGDLSELQKERAMEAAALITPWKKVGEHAGIFADEWKYVMELGKAGHPTYAGFVRELLEARSLARQEIQRNVAVKAMEPEAVESGLAERVLAMEERDRWTRETERQSEINKLVINGPVTLMTDFGDAAEVDHGPIEDAIFEEVE